MDLEITILSELSQTDEDTQFTCHSPSPLEVFLGGVDYEMAWQRDGREFPTDLKKALVTDLMSLVIFSDYSCSLSHYWVSMCVHAKSLNRVPLFATPGTLARQAPLSMGFSGQEHWRGLPCPPPGGLPNPGIEPMSLYVSCKGRQVLCHHHLGTPWMSILNTVSLWKLLTSIKSEISEYQSKVLFLCGLNHLSKGSICTANSPGS